MCDNNACSVEEDVAKTKEELQNTEESLQQERKEEEKRMAQLEILLQQLEHQQMSKEKRRKDTEAFINKLDKELQQEVREIKEVKKRERTNIREKMKEMFREQLKLEGQLQSEDMIGSSSKHSLGLHHGHLSVSSTLGHSVPKSQAGSDHSKSRKSSFQNSISQQNSPQSRIEHHFHTTRKATSTSFKDTFVYNTIISESVWLNPSDHPYNFSSFPHIKDWRVLSTS